MIDGAKTVDNRNQPIIRKVAAMKTVLTTTIVLSLVVFLVMFLSHVFLLTKALQCSYDEQLFLAFRPPLNLGNILTDADKEIISMEISWSSRMRDCKFATFLEEKFVFVDFSFDCVTVTGPDGRNQSTGSDCESSSYLKRQPTVFFNDNKTVFLKLLNSENVIYSKDGLYICS